jgi:hypothetical protein
VTGTLRVKSLPQCFDSVKSATVHSCLYFTVSMTTLYSCLYTFLTAAFKQGVPLENFFLMKFLHCLCTFLAAALKQGVA